ncbi:MAG: cobalt-precorrin-6A reductase [Paracoccaceae bacterium]
MKLLLLAGTREARLLADALAADPAYQVTASLSGATREPRELPVPTRRGGFGGDDGFVDWLIAHRPDAVIDATHPYARRITERTARICAEMGLRYLLVQRPGWQAGPGDNWTEIAREEDAAALIAPDACVFLATGRQNLSRFGGLAGRRVICRQIDAPDAPFPFAGGEFLVGRPPFSVRDEEQLFADLGVDWLVVKNAGGAQSRTKLDAARNLGLPVLMIARAPPPAGVERVETADQALRWLKALA